ncbi:Hypothetical protein, predicted transmembrane protein [Ureaplasma diversum NCTC 246]|uniref:Uncharacterized protein n=2 Tax=Ureaplasma diversum TaxID=42094 RepID=A0A084F0Z7_9BACT|nr:Hypothetical protein, predicted transmembrane protein [Ureaplasma diversum NCTC 246]
MFDKTLKTNRKMISLQIALLFFTIVWACFIVMYFLTGSIVTSGNIGIRAIAVLLGTDPNQADFKKHLPELAQIGIFLEKAILNSLANNEKQLALLNLIAVGGIIGAGIFCFFIGFANFVKVCVMISQVKEYNRSAKIARLDNKRNVVILIMSFLWFIVLINVILMLALSVSWKVTTKKMISEHNKIQTEQFNNKTNYMY